MSRRKMVLVIAAAVVAGLVCGCSSQSAHESSRDNISNTEADNTESQTAVIGNIGEREQTAKERVVNNGGHFVKIGDKIYFREYAADALETTVVWGNFLDFPRENKMSLIRYYDESTGKTETAFEDIGYGGLYYMDGRFYFTRYLENTENIVYSVDKNGSNLRLESYGRIVGGYEPSGVIVIQRVYDAVYSTLEFLYADGRRETLPEDADYYFRKQEEQYLFYEGYGQNEGGTVWCLDLSGDNEPVKLGNAPVNEYEVSGNLEAVEIRGDTGYLFYAFRAGTGNYFYQGMIMKCKLREAGSIQLAMEVGGEEGNGDRPGMSVSDSGEITLMENTPGELITWNNVLYLVDQDGERQQINKEVEPVFDDSTNIEYVLGKPQMIDGMVYAYLYKQRHSEEDDIGWRWSYTLLDTTYVAISVDTGETREFAEVEAEKEPILARVWLLDSSDGSGDSQSCEILYQKMVQIEEAGYAYIPLIQDTYKIEVANNMKFSYHDNNTYAYLEEGKNGFQKYMTDEGKFVFPADVEETGEMVYAVPDQAYERGSAILANLYLDEEGTRVNRIDWIE